MQTANLESPHRPATPNDSAELAELVNQAGEGMPLYLWQKMGAESGEDPWVVGQKRAMRESGAFSYRNATVRVADGAVVAALLGYALSTELDPARFDDMPPMFVPLQELEDLVPGTWYVNVLATFAAHRGKGYGTDLLAVAEHLARESGCSGLSLVVADANTGARRLYQANGYAEVATRPMVKEDWDGRGEHWVLMTRGLAA